MTASRAVGALVLLVLAGCGATERGAADETSSGSSPSRSASPSPSPATPPPSTSSEGGGGGPEAVAEGYLAAVNDRDTEAAQRFTCPGRTLDFSSLPEGETYALAGAAEVRGDQAQVLARSTSGTPRTTFIMPLAKRGDRWCLDG